MRNVGALRLLVVVAVYTYSADVFVFGVRCYIHKMTRLLSGKQIFKFYEAFRVSSRVRLLKCTDVWRNTVSPIDRVLGGDWWPDITWASIYT
jgi:hypothetical protein